MSILDALLLPVDSGLGLVNGSIDRGVPLWRFYL